MSAQAEPGDVIRGFAGGLFGRDSYDDKYVIAVGRDWIVAREESGGVVLASGPDVHEYLAFITKEENDHEHA